ncbi:MAG: hypothetical protein WC774_01020 [Candidatus Gracilibacteria bacterium]|jgi:hypothetical protein
MKKLSIFLSVLIVTALCFWAFSLISMDNQYTSVRKYTKPKAKIPVVENVSLPSTTVDSTVVPVDNTTPIKRTVAPIKEVVVPPTTTVVVDTTPPTIEILNYKDGDVVTTSTIDIQVKVTDDHTPPDKIVVDGAGKHTLTNGSNTIIITALDEAGNAGSTYIIIEKK